MPLRNVSPAAVAAVIASEDATFCLNDGVDWGALHKVLSGAGKDGPSRGASTITMQTAKNLFLWPGRSVVRKGVEVGMALALGKAWSKARTIEIYLNIAEWGDGLYGIEAAARRYFHKSASELDRARGGAAGDRAAKPDSPQPRPSDGAPPSPRRECRSEGARKRGIARLPAAIGARRPGSARIAPQRRCGGGAWGFALPADRRYGDDP